MLESRDSKFGEILTKTQNELSEKHDKIVELQRRVDFLEKYESKCVRVCSERAELLEKCQFLQLEYEKLKCEYE